MAEVRPLVPWPFSDGRRRPGDGRWTVPRTLGHIWSPSAALFLLNHQVSGWSELEFGGNDDGITGSFTSVGDVLETIWPTTRDDTPTHQEGGHDRRGGAGESRSQRGESTLLFAKKNDNNNNNNNNNYYYYYY